jgi:hypothetical protein
MEDRSEVNARLVGVEESGRGAENVVVGSVVGTDRLDTVEIDAVLPTLLEPTGAEESDAMLGTLQHSGGGVVRVEAVTEFPVVLNEEEGVRVKGVEG